MKLIGIDLGTTNSAIAMVNEFGKAEIIPNKEGERITPSVVLFDDDQIIVGSVAKQSSVAEPERTVSSIKSHIGASDYIFEYKKNEYKPEDISAMILRKLIEDAESFLNEKITDVVITVPAYFNDKQRKATIDSGKISGVHVTQIINEPTAAALTYGLDKKINQKILVYDLGGGTFDVTIMSVNNMNFNVISSDGDRQLGGNNFDEKLMIYLNDKFQQQHDIDLFEDPVLIQDLRLKSENAKKVLSSKLSTTVYLSAKGKSARVTVTRKLFSDLIADFITRTELLVNAVMTDANLEWKDIEQVLLVGGSTRIPSVQDMIFRVTGKKPSTQVNPDEAVALGAAIQAGIISAKDQNEDVNDMVRMKYGAMNVSDVTTHSFGAITLDEFDNKRNAIIIPKNSKIPVRKSQIFYTSSVNQKQVKMVVIQGEDPDPDFCTTIGTTTLDFPPKPENSPIIFNYEYDVNGIIHATAKDPDTGKKSEIQITREGALTKEQISQKKNKLNSMFPRRREYITKASSPEDSTENFPNPQNTGRDRRDTGASLVNDVFVGAGLNDSESFEGKQIYSDRISGDSIKDDGILEKSEMETITSKDLKRELDGEATIPGNTPDMSGEMFKSSNFIERFDNKKGEVKPKNVNRLKIEKESFDEFTEDEQIERIDEQIEAMFEDENQSLSRGIENTESFDDALDEIATVSKKENSSKKTKFDEDDKEELDSVFDSFDVAESGVAEEEYDNPDEEIENIKLGDIEKKQAENEFDNISMEDSSVVESQSFDDELDEIGKSEFIIDRSEYLTDEDIMRIKEEGNTKSGVQLSDINTEQEESFTEDEVNQLFSSQDSKNVNKADKAPEKVKEIKKTDIMDWIDD
ncbi:MAG: Hsp70 family protein [Candidatus Delongbacteria bacterium]|nr:Hsp70 family protein [Candidatus Delongbacteria bacterium]MCG2760870.1 Hsp70 family protein [Candidatus Delongbacteria bacterium]